MAVQGVEKMYQSHLVDLPKSVIQKRPLAPAPERNYPGAKKKIQFVSYNPQPASVARRNARERNRVKQVNNGFAALRQHIPANVMTAFGATENTGRGSKKLSKVETLKVAVEYIKSLQKMLEEHEAEGAAKGMIGIVENRYYSPSPDVQYAYQMPLPTPPSSEASASPTPSHTSEISSSPYPATYLVPETFKTFESKSPEDDELLDAIFSWQQSE